MRTWTQLLGAALILGLAAWAGEGWARSATPPPTGTRGVSVKKIDANNWETYVDNSGMHTVPYRGVAGGYWPKGSGHNYIFGAGIWVGTLFNSGADTNVAWGYNPNSGASNMGPVTPDWDETKSGDPAARVYLSNDPTDRQQWPELDSTGKAKIRSVLDSWAAFSDVNPVYTKTPDKPFGVGVKRISYQWPYPGYSDIIFFLFTVKNLTKIRPVTGGAKTFTDCIIGNNMDCDIGNESGTAANDQYTLNMTFYHKANGDSVYRNLAMQFQTAQENGWGPPPYWEGARFFESPRATKPVTITSANHPEANRTVLPGQQLGMTACKLFTLSTDPSKAPQRYMELAGYYYLNPVYEPYDLDFPGPGDHRFLQSSGPFDLAPDSSVNMTIAIIGGKDSAAVVGTSDKAQEIYDSNFLAPFPPSAPNLTLIPGNKMVTLLWDNLSETTPDPYYDLISDSTQKAKYRKYDFEGYKVYKARTLANLGDATKRILLAQYDLKDGFTIVRDKEWKFFQNPQGQKESLTVWDTLGTDSGIRYTLVDSGTITGDSLGMANGFPYFYGVVGFDYQYWDSIGQHWPGSPTSLIGEPTEKYGIAVPRADAENLSYAGIDSLKFTTGGGAYPGVITYSPKVVVSKNVPNTAFTFRWNPVQKDSLFYGVQDSIGGYPIYSFNIRDEANNLDLGTVKVVLDTTGGWTGVPERIPVFSGISFDARYKLTPPALKRGAGRIYPAASYTDTVFADTILSLPGITSYIPMKWCWRGSDSLAITWHRSGGSTGDSLLSISARDLTNSVDIPFEGGRNTPGIRQSSWAFGVDPDSGGHQYIDSVSCSGPYAPAGRSKNARWLYLCGYRYLFNYHTIAGQRRPDKMAWARRPGDGEVWYVVQSGPKPPLDGNYMTFTPTAQTLAAATQDQLDRIMVVPNPYLVRNNWDNSELQKHLMFTHLPDACTIRIFTLAGDLVKVIYHNTTNDFAALGGKVPNTGTTGDRYGTGGTEFWDLLTYNTQKIASGVYLYRVDAGDKHKIGKFAVIQ